jgi:hypothetical protein
MTPEELIQKQYDYEQEFKSFPNNFYIRRMSFCSHCNGRGYYGVGERLSFSALCAYCSGHGWSHTTCSMAFGRGLNSDSTDMNPYSSYEEYPEFAEFKAGQGRAWQIQVFRIQSNFGIVSDVNDSGGSL